MVDVNGLVESVWAREVFEAERSQAEALASLRNLMRIDGLTDRHADEIRDWLAGRLECEPPEYR